MSYGEEVFVPLGDDVITALHAQALDKYPDLDPDAVIHVAKCYHPEKYVVFALRPRCIGIRVSKVWEVAAALLLAADEIEPGTAKASLVEIAKHCGYQAERRLVRALPVIVDRDLEKPFVVIE